MAAVAYSTISPVTPVADLRAMSISTLSDLLDACDAAVPALLGIINLPCTSDHARGQIEEWMEGFGFHREAVIAELERRRPTSKAEEVVRLRALVSRVPSDCETPFDVVSYVTRLHSGVH